MCRRRHFSQQGPCGVSTDLRAVAVPHESSTPRRRMVMNWVDFAIVGVVALSAIISVVRGFVSETVSLVVWIASFWAALHFGPELAAAMSGFIDTVSVRMVSAFVILFLSVCIFGSLINYFLSKAVKDIGLGGADRVLGEVFGMT